MVLEVTRQHAPEEAWALNLVVETVVSQASLQSPVTCGRLTCVGTLNILICCPQESTKEQNSNILFWSSFCKYSLGILSINDRYISILWIYILFDINSILNIVLNNEVTLCSKRQDEGRSPAGLPSAEVCFNSWSYFTLVTVLFKS